MKTTITLEAKELNEAVIKYMEKKGYTVLDAEFKVEMSDGSKPPAIPYCECQVEPKKRKEKA